MASFTDNVPQFNPYVSQQPVEAMVQVGMMKQQQYDTNLEKIYQSMSNVAGMDILREKDQDYLKDKMSSVSKKLKVYASGDFSQSNLTRGVNNMINNIADDKVIQNSVRSTMAVRQAKKLQSEYTTSGKGSPANDWLLNSELQKWYDNPEAGATFNGTYKPYQDYNAKALTVIKGVLEDENISEKDYYIDANGKVTFSDISVTTKVAGKAKEKIQTALMAQLSPADWEQIQVDGRYQYSNMDGEGFASSYQNSYASRMTELSSEKDKLIGQKKAASSPQEQQRLSQLIADIDVKIGKDDTEYKSINGLIEGENYEAAKAKLYSMSWMNNTANAFSSSKTSETFKRSDRADFAFDRQKEQRRINEYNADYVFKGQVHQDNMRVAAAKLAVDKEANRLKITDLGDYGSLATGKDQKEIVTTTPGVLQAEIDIAKQVTQNDKIEIGKYYVSEDEYKKSGLTDKYKTYDAYAANYMDQQEKLYKKSSGSVKGKVRDFFSAKAKSDRVIATKQQVKDEVEKKSAEKYNKDVNAVITNNVTTPITFEDGRSMEVSTKELVAFNTKYEELFKNVGFGNQAKALPLMKQTSLYRGLSEKEKTLLDIRFKEENDYGGLTGLFGQGLSNAEQKVSNLIFDAKSEYGSKAKSIVSEQIKFENDAIASKLFAMQGRSHTIPLSTKQGPNGSQKDQFRGVLEQFALEADKTGGLVESPGVTGETIRNISANLESAVITIVEDVPDGNGGTKKVHQISVTNNKGAQTAFKISDKQFQDVFPTQFRTTPELVRFNEYKKRIIATSPEDRAIGTTAMNGGFTNKNNAYLQNTDFPNVKLFGISGNLVSKDGLHYDLEINLQDPRTKTWAEGIEFNTDVLDVDMQVQMDNINDVQILEMLIGRRPTDAEIKQLEEYSKNTD